MERSEAEGMIQLIETSYDKRYGQDSREKLINDCMREPIESARALLKHIENNSVMYRPNPIELVKMLRDFSATTREKESRERKEEWKEAKPTSQHSERAGMLVAGLLSGKMTRRMFLEGFRHMESTCQGVGWNLKHGEMKHFYEKNNLDLDKPPSNFISFSF